MLSSPMLKLSIWVAVVILLLVTAVAAAQEAWLHVVPDDGVVPQAAERAAPPEVAVVCADDTGLRLRVETPGLMVSPRPRAEGAFVQASWPGAAMTGEIGAPAIPVVRKLFIAPPGVEVVAAAACGTPLIIDEATAGGSLLLMPVQPPIEKVPGALEQATFQQDAAAYALDVDVPATRVAISEVGLSRGQRLFLLEIRPLAYNAAARRITLWPKMEIDVRFNGQAGAAAGLSPIAGLDRAVLNPPNGFMPRTGTGNYLIITAPAYASGISSFVSAKQAQGYTVSTWTAPAGSTNSQIKTYIQGLWGGPNAPDYILLVGDTDTIPHWIGGGAGNPPTDLPYTCMDGAADWMPDIAIGRFPVRSTTQLSNVIAKVLNFENGPVADPGYWLRAVFMASEDNYPVSEGTHNYCINTYMIPNNIVSDRLYCHTYGATTQQVRNAFNAGRLYGIYSGHGSEYSWADGPPFTQADVNGLTNANMYSWVCSFACITGSYHLTECFAETWILAPNKGAAAIWASSVNSYWTEDDVLQRILFSVLFDDYIRETGPAFNQTRVRYLAQMGSGSTTRRYFEMYNLLGEPATYVHDANAGITVSPNEGLDSEGPIGGPFFPSIRTYRVTNAGGQPVVYEVTHDPAATWLSVSGPTSGTLPPFGFVDIVVEYGPEAAALPGGTYQDVVAFTNISNHVGDTTRPVRLDVGRTVVTWSEPAAPIVDNQTTQRTLYVDADLCLADVDVSVSITHPRIGDLLVQLRSPSGTLVTLHNRGGGSTANLNKLYDDETVPPDGPGTLADFDGRNAMGTWTLLVSDQVNGGQGTLNGWSLRLLPSAGPACPPVAANVSVTTTHNTPVCVTMTAASDPGDDPWCVIESLPAHGTLSDVLGNPITSVPCAMPPQQRDVFYTPAAWYGGNDSFSYSICNDCGGSNTAVVRVLVGERQLIRAFDLATNPGWIALGQWAFGVPLGGGSGNGDPTSGYTGDNVYGYNLAGDYANNLGPQYLQTGPVNCTAGRAMELRFRRWLGIQAAPADRATVQVSANAINWTTIWSHTGAAIAESDWSLQTFDVSGVADGAIRVYVRWGMGPTDGSGTAPGWNLDDMEFWGVAPHACLGSVAGDVSGDGAIDGDDVQAFVRAVVDSQSATQAERCAADFNLDGAADSLDVPLFVTRLLSEGN